MLRSSCARAAKAATWRSASKAICRASVGFQHQTAALSSASKKNKTAPINITRPNPAPSFNAEESEAEKAALAVAEGALMDDSFIGLSGGQIFHEMMLRHDVDTIFGYSGGAILPVFDGIYNSPHFKFIVPRHEQGAGHMAEGYAKVTGKPGVILVTSGPGATNIVTPLQDALSDGIPMVAFSGQVPTTALGTDAFQEADVVGITRSCTKWNVMVKSIDELPKRINEAFEIATSGRPGPVLVDLPKDITASVLRNSIPTETTIPSRALANLNSIAINEFQESTIKRAADLVNKAKKPIIYAGNGILSDEQGPKLLKKLAETAQIPVTTTLHGLGSFDEEHELSLRMVGMHGSAYANKAIQEADLIIALGARFDERVTGTVAKFAPGARLADLEKRGGIIHFEVSPKNINKVIQATEAIEGDVTANLERMLPFVRRVESRPEWMAEINEWKKNFPLRHKADAPGEAIQPQTVITALSEVVDKEKTIITTGVGQHQMWAAQFYKFKHPRTLITSGGLGTMGFGLPSAIGAKVGHPEYTVIDIDGDASFNMTLTELSCAVQYGIDVKVIILNNEEQGMVTQWQSLFYEDRYAHTHLWNPDFIRLAESMGVTGIRVEKLEDLKPKLREMLATKGPTLVEVMVDSKVPVLPMVPAGKGLQDCIVYDERVEEERRQLRNERLKRLSNQAGSLAKKVQYN